MRYQRGLHPSVLFRYAIQDVERINPFVCRAFEFVLQGEAFNIVCLDKRILAREEGEWLTVV